jgi:PIN domain nuclease of toxin-antitoxin system
MQLLLDTPTLLWALAEPDRLSDRVRTAITDGTTSLYVSAVSAWEISTKHRNGKLPQADALVFGYSEHLSRLGAKEISVTSRHALAAGALEWNHRDPFDRMLAAQSMIESLRLATIDQVFAGLPGIQAYW